MVTPETTRPKHDGRPWQKGQSGNPAGRPKGAVNKRTREIADRAIAEGLSPLEVMLKGMRQAYEAGDWDNAHKFAASAAPYIHPKLQAIEHGGMEDNRITVVIQRFSDAPEAVEHAET